MSAWFWQWLRLPGWPPMPRSLWLALGCFLVCQLNMLFYKELWIHTPQAERLFATGIWLTTALAPAQLTWLAWHWLEVWQGPVVARGVAKGLFWLAVGLGAIPWLLLVLVGWYYAFIS